MSTETIFRQLGRLNDSHTGIGPGRTREEYLNLFSRASYSTENEWPHSSPLSGFYDVSNTSTRLILLNQRYKFSHLRGKILPKETSHTPEDEYKTVYESILQSEQPQPKTKRTHKQILPKIPVNPYRHFESMFYIIIRSCLLLLFFSCYIIQGQNKYWHNRMCKGSFSTDDTDDSSPIETNMTLELRRPHTASSLHRKRTRSSSARRRSQSVSGTHDKLLNNFQADPGFTESLWQYYHYHLEKTQRPKLGLQQYRIKEPSNRLLRQSGIYRNPALTRGQKLYLLEKCHIYDVDDAKTRHTNSYLQVLTKRRDADSFYKPEFRLNDPRDYFSYEKFVKTPRPTARPLNTGYFTSKQPHRPRIPSEHKRQQSAIRSNSYHDKKDFINIANSSFTNEKLPKEKMSHLSRHISASTIPTKNENTINFRFRQHSKEIAKIPVLPSQSHD